MNFLWKKGLIVTKRLQTANIFLVRVMPDMAEIQEIDLLPTYAPFFKDENIAYGEGDEVWLLTTEDFTVGYIFGGFQNPRGGAFGPLLNLVNESEDKAGFPKSNPSDISIRSVGGRSIFFENVETGTCGQIFNSKITHLYGPNGESYLSYPHYSISTNSLGDMRATGRNVVEQFKDIVSSSSSLKEITGSKETESAGPIVSRAGGPIKEVTASYKEEAVAGDSQELVAKKKKETYGLGLDTTVVAGGHKEKVLVGNFSLTVVAGKIELTSSAGIHLRSPHVSIKTAKLDLSSPLFNTPKGGVVVPSGSGGLCALPFCLLTGAPHVGSTQIGGI